MGTAAFRDLCEAGVGGLRVTASVVYETFFKQITLLQYGESYSDEAGFCSFARQRAKYGSTI